MSDLEPHDHNHSCFLCASDRHSIAAQLTGAQLRNLWQVLGTSFNANSWLGIADGDVVQMYRCGNCGFLFFDPRLAGKEAFYDSLAQPGYYSSHRLEFQRTLNFARSQNIKRILDVGCGSGIFLDMAHKVGFETFGLDLNSKAAEEARRKGHKIFECLLSDLDSEQAAGTFDMITLFQVLEHVPEPVKTLLEARERLRPGGLVSIAVPSAEGINRLTLKDPSIWPPHHLSLWRRADFPVLARAAGMKLLGSGGDSLLGSTIETRWKLRNKLAPVFGKPPLLGNALPELLSVLYRKLGLKFIFPHWGSSVYAYFQKI